MPPTGAIVPYVPYPDPVPPPTLTGSDVCITIDEGLAPYVIGACKALLAASTWRSADPTVIKNTILAVNDLLNQLMGEACNMTVSFDQSTDDGDAGDGLVHVTITPDTDDNGAFNVSVKHPAYLTTDDDTLFLSKVPTNSNADTIDTSNTSIGLTISGPGMPLDAISSADQPAGYFQQSRTSPVDQPVLQLQRHTLSSAPILRTVPTGGGSGANVDTINGHGEVVAIGYDALPAADATHLGAIVRLNGGGSNNDALYECVFGPLGYVWTLFQGPAGSNGAPGATGPQGPQGPQPVFNSPAETDIDYGTSPTVAIAGDGSTGNPYHLSFGLPTSPSFGTPLATGLIAGASPTASLTGAGTVADPKILHLGIPAGATGQFNIPPLPSPGGNAISFLLPVFGDGTYLPFVLPVNYKMTVEGQFGEWEGDSTNFATITDGLGTNYNTTLNNLNYGRLLYEVWLVSNGVIQNSPAPQDAINATHISSGNELIRFRINISEASDGTRGNLWVTIVITPPPVSGAGIQTIDFTSSAQMWTQTPDNGVFDGTTQPWAIWNSGHGWTNLPFLSLHYNSRFRIWARQAYQAHVTAIYAQVSNDQVGIQANLTIRAGTSYNSASVFEFGPGQPGAGVTTVQLCGDPGVLPAGEWWTINWDSGGNETEDSNGHQVQKLFVHYADYPPF